MAAARPKYFSDGDSRPLYRGKAYALLRTSGVGWLALCLYLAHALASLASTRLDGGGAALFVCRCLLSAALCWNTVLSDDLHNLDIHMGRAYDAPSTLPIEQRLHAHDWRAALAVPASYHLLLVLGVIDAHRIETLDWLLLLGNLAVCAVMWLRISPSRITPRRELFLSFVGTFVVQMLLLLLAFCRERAHHGWWLPVWGMCDSPCRTVPLLPLGFVCTRPSRCFASQLSSVNRVNLFLLDVRYAVGLIAKGLEWPQSDIFGHHELMHAATIAGHGAGLLVDTMTT
ncbi:MAG: hypothetical protein SGPRY_009852 [Prymnesium sp.]